MSLSRRTLLLSTAANAAAQEPAAAPVVILVAPRQGLHLSCVGTAGLRTPRLDALAERGTLYTRAYAVAPVAAFEAMVAVEEPRTAYTKALELFREKPPLAMVTLPEDPQFANARRAVDPADVELPALWPDLPGIRARWIRYLNTLQCFDALAGAVLDAIERVGWRETAVVYYTSRGGLAGPAPLHDIALRVPLIAAGPGLAVNARRGELVSNAALPRVEAGEYLQAHGGRSVTVFDRRYRYIRHGDAGLRPEPITELEEARQQYPAHWRLWSGPIPQEEFFDLAADPWEMNSVMRDAAYAPERDRLAALVSFTPR